MPRKRPQVLGVDLNRSESGRQVPVPRARPRTVPDTTLDRIRCPAVSKSVSEEPMRARRQRNLSRHQKFFCKNVFHRKVYPLYRDGTIFGQVFVRGGMTKIGKSPLPGGQARRNKLLVSRGPLVIAPPLAGSLLAPLRCAAPCQSRA